MAPANRFARVAASPLNPREGYSLVSSAYENRNWFGFWIRNEKPIVRKWVSSLGPGKFLDAGSGTGLYRTDLESCGHPIIAVDLSLEMLKRQKQLHGALDSGRYGEIIQADIQALPFRKASFKYLLCTRVLSHIELLSPVFAEFARVVENGGELLISDVHPKHRYNDLSIEENGERVSIRVYKHEIRTMLDSAAKASLRVIELREFGLSDLIWKPPNEGFERVYEEPAQPIFYICRLGRI